MSDQQEEVIADGVPVDEAGNPLESGGDAVSVHASQLEELAAGEAGEGMGLSHLMDVPVRVTVEVGRTKMRLSELVHLSPGSLLELDRAAHEPADILVNGKIVARGEIVTIDKSYGVRITEVE